MKFVLDASVALTWLLADGKSSDLNYARQVLETLSHEDTGAVVPAIWPFEISNVIAKAETKDLLTEAQSEAFLELLAELDIDMDADSALRAPTSILQLARRYRLSSYDASYLETALRLGLPLATLDIDLQKAARKAGVVKYGP